MRKVLAFDIEADLNNLKDNEYYKNSINKLIDLFKTIGIPRKIIVRDNYIKNIITDLNLITELNVEVLDVQTNESFGFTVAKVELPFNSKLPGWQFLDLSKALLLEYKFDLIEGLQNMNFGYIDSEDTVE